jgi:hypothetical protein
VVEKKKLQKNELVNVLDKLSNHLNTPLKGYLIGGLAMIFHGNKISTKDIDIIFESVEQANLFESAIDKIGFKRIQDLSVNYINLETRNVFEGIKGIRFDIFVEIDEQVFNELKDKLFED